MRSSVSSSRVQFEPVVFSRDPRRITGNFVNLAPSRRCQSNQVTPASATGGSVPVEGRVRVKISFPRVKSRRRALTSNENGSVKPTRKPETKDTVELGELRNALLCSSTRCERTPTGRRYLGWMCVAERKKNEMTRTLGTADRWSAIDHRQNGSITKGDWGPHPSRRDRRSLCVALSRTFHKILPPSRCRQHPRNLNRKKPSSIKNNHGNSV